MPRTSFPSYLQSLHQFRPTKPSHGFSGTGLGRFKPQGLKTPGSFQTYLLFTMYSEQASILANDANFYFFRRQFALTRRRRSVRAPNNWRRATALYCCHTRPRISSPIQDDSPSRLVARPVRSAAIVRSRQRQDKTNGGAERDRTADPLLAKQVLSQLSYSPIQLDHPSLINQARQQFASTNSLNPNPHSHMQMVGPGRLELPTPRLSSVCSNQLSYGPIPVPVDAAFVFLKKEKRGRRTSPYHPSARHFRGVLRFDGRLTGAIYVLKSTGRFILIRSGVLPIPQLP